MTFNTFSHSIQGGARSFIHEKMEQRKKIGRDSGGGEGYRQLEGEAVVT